MNVKELIPDTPFLENVPVIFIFQSSFIRLNVNFLI